MVSSVMENMNMKTEKYLAVSDIHGALDGAETLLEAIRRHQPDRILCPGDILYHGPRNDLPASYAPKKVIEIMNSLKDKIIAVRGNCEAEVDQMVLEFACMADYRTIPFGKRTVYMSHGHIYNPERLPDLDAGSIFLYGHTHIPCAYQKEGIYILNPGSVSLPKNGHPRSYGILEESGFTVYRDDHTEYMHIDL